MMVLRREATREAMRAADLLCIQDTVRKKKRNSQPCRLDEARLPKSSRNAAQKAILKYGSHSSSQVQSNVSSFVVVRPKLSSESGEGELRSLPLG